ncbi:hypothetical protein [Streptomyces sp. NRRL F-2664]|uniref:hypothetical protein n=1 Tax=Streptomyces sp. NRRL F-2664 TaxID=1463842 RepID=UPI00131EA37E|nr:hypothetical protein [Streptomyces sp. NRRL F-2664]
MPDPQDRNDGRSPLERVTGENDVSPQEERERGTSPAEGKGRIQEAAQKVKDAAKEALGTGKREATEATPEAREVLRERGAAPERGRSPEGPGGAG